MRAAAGRGSGSRAQLSRDDTVRGRTPELEEHHRHGRRVGRGRHGGRPVRDGRVRGEGHQAAPDRGVQAAGRGARQPTGHTALFRGPPARRGRRQSGDGRYYYTQFVLFDGPRSV